MAADAAETGAARTSQAHHEFTLHCFAQSGVAEFGRRAQAAWAILDAHLARRRFVVADRPTIADLSLCGYLFFDDEIGVDWNNYPNVRDWLARLRALPRWKHPYDLMPGHPRPGVA